MENLKRVVIKEELVKLTGDFKKAVVLNQMIYWSQRVRDFDKFIIEEKNRAEMYGTEASNKELTNGWVYKKAEELIEETMLGISNNTMGRILESLVSQGWIDRRRNPRMALDKTYQYRINLLNLQKDLLAIGYHLEGYKVNIDCQNDNTKCHGDNRNVKMTIEVSKWDSKCQNDTAIPEITNRDYNTESTTTTESENRVVVVREKYESLFQKKLTKKQAEDLITLADKHQVDLIKKMENTYKMHRVEPRKSIVAAIKYAIVNGDWEIASSTVSNPKPLPKAVADQLKGKRGQQELTREQLEAKKLEIQRKIAMLEGDIVEAF
jgi:anti-sigma28 factor (negative regulator of flagellin synthesis)